MIMNKKSNYILSRIKHFGKIRFIHLSMFLLSIIITCLTVIVIAQEKEVKIDKAEQKEVAANISDILNKNYVLPETAKKMSAYIIEKLKKGEYDELTHPEEFARQLGEDLRHISKDRHIRISYNPETVKELMKEKEEGKEDPEALEKWLKEERRNNFGFREVKILDGNVGYMDLREFIEAKYAGAIAVAAMNFLSNCDALIIDLRKNGGGQPGMIQLLTSYFYEDEAIQLSSLYWRPEDKTEQYWTLPYVPGKKMADIDIYVLTSRRTFSAAEAFCYDLKHLKRATLIGEATGGGAHPGGPMVINDNFYIWVPQGRAINPITKTNWEGMGVKPHIEVPQENALQTAYLKALEKLTASARDKDDKFRYNWYIEFLKTELNPFQIEPSILNSYVGQYGPRTITFENGELYYQREGRPKYKMIPMSSELFMFKEMGYFHIKFILENGKVKALIGLYDDGRTVTLFQK